MEPYGSCKTPVVKTKVSDVRIHMLGFIDSENGCTQGSFLKRMHARVSSDTDARNQKGHLDGLGCTQYTFGQRMRARYGVNPGCAQPTSRTVGAVIGSVQSFCIFFFLQQEDQETSKSKDT